MHVVRCTTDNYSMCRGCDWWLMNRHGVISHCTLSYTAFWHRVPLLTHHHFKHIAWPHLEQNDWLTDARMRLQAGLCTAVRLPVLGAATLLCVLWAGVLACHTITEEVEPTLLPAVKHDLHCMYSIFELVKGAPLCVKFLHVCIVINV